MKNGKRPTRRQKQALEYVNLSPDMWLVFKVEADRLHIVHRELGSSRIIPA